MTGRIIVADDHPLFREGMLSILQRLLPEARIEEAGDLAGVLRLAGEGEQPDSLILDLRFPGLTRIEMLADLRRRFPRTTLIVVSMVDDPQLIGEVMNAGADGFLGKSIAPEELGQAILAIRAGEVLVLSLIHISEPTRQAEISYAVFCLKKKKKRKLKKKKKKQEKK